MKIRKTPLRYAYRILCILRREHYHHEEVMINKNTTRNYCKCDKWLEFDWSHVGGYKKSINQITELIRKKRWENKS